MIRTLRFVTLLGAAVALVWLYAVAGAEEAAPPLPPPAYPCPNGIPSCKVVTISPDEEASLIGDNMIFAHAEWANRAGLAGVVQAWRNKIASAPLGRVAKPVEKK